MEEPRQAEIADAYGAGAGDHYVGGFEVAMQDPVAVEVEKAVEQLEEDGLDHWGGDGAARTLLGMVVDDLQEVVFTVLKDHEDAFLFEDNFDEMDQVRVGELRAESDFADGGLGKAGVLQRLALLVGLKLLDGEELGWRRVGGGSSVASLGLVDTAVGAAADEADDAILVVDFGPAGVGGAILAVQGFCEGGLDSKDERN